MKYHQITTEERYMISALRLQGFTNADIARHLGRDRSSIGREIRRNRCNDGDYRPSTADSRTRRRRRESRRRWHFSDRHLQLVSTLLRLDWSPEQIAGWLRIHRVFSISTLIGKLKARTTAELHKRVISLIKRQTRHVRTLAADNGTEFHNYPQIEQATGAAFYFATPYHSWERGLNENTNGLIRQYLPKGKTMRRLTQRHYDAIASNSIADPVNHCNFKHRSKSMRQHDYCCSSRLNLRHAPQSSSAKSIIFRAYLESHGCCRFDSSA